MTRVLRQEIKEAILSNNQLAADFCDAIGVLIISLPQMLNRNVKRLTHHDSITWLSERLNKIPDEILTEDAKVTA